MGTLITAIYDFLAWLMSAPWSLVVALGQWVEDFVTVSIPNIAWALLPSGVVEFLSSLPASGIDTIIQSVTWFFPFWVIAGIYINAYALCGGIRLVRFIIGWVPTIEG